MKYPNLCLRECERCLGGLVPYSEWNVYEKHEGLKCISCGKEYSTTSSRGQLNSKYADIVSKLENKPKTLKRIRTLLKWGRNRVFIARKFDIPLDIVKDIDEGKL